MQIDAACQIEAAFAWCANARRDLYPVHLGGGSGPSIRLGRTAGTHLAEEIIDLGPRNAEVNEQLRGGTAFLVEQTE